MIIKPFAEVCPFLDRIGFKITCLELDKTSDGWLRVYTRWGIKKPKFENLEYHTKYPTIGGFSIGYDERSVNLEFPGFGQSLEFKPLNRAKIKVGVYHFYDNNSDDPVNRIPIKWDYRFFESIKYGANVYFSPRGWNSGPDTPMVYHNDEKLDENGEMEEQVFIKSSDFNGDGTFIVE